VALHDRPDGRRLRDARHLPYYGPFGDIKDVVACEDQFRNAFLLGCVGTWSLHPVQIAIAKKVFSPEREDVAHARRRQGGDG
jgi:malyl-CoA/(S)-citramalyl-CoA lyase